MSILSATFKSVTLEKSSFRWLDSATTFFLFAYAATASHSIALSQGSCVLAVMCWILRSLAISKWNLVRTPADWPLLIFFIFCLLSSIFSYEPLLSIDGLRSIAFLGAIYFIASYIKNVRQAITLSLILIFSCQINVIYTLCQRLRGEGIRLTNFTSDSPFREAHLQPGDVILAADNHFIRNLETLSKMAEQAELKSVIRLRVRRGEWIFETSLKKSSIKNNISTSQGNRYLGVIPSVAYDFRATGFYSHYATYAEVLQIIASIIFGMWLTTFRTEYLTNRNDLLGFFKRKINILFGVIFLSTFLALFCTMTRAPIIGLVVSIISMFLIRYGSKQLSLQKFLLLICIVISIVVSLAIIYSTRGMDISDAKEGSMFWRLVVWQEGIHLVEHNPILGIGKNSDLIHGKDWGLWAADQLPRGHFHNTYLQIAVWWGIPALIAYLFMMWKFGYTLFKNYKTCANRVQNIEQRLSTGMILGTLGALIGFMISSIVHFNFGDGEVIMVLWLAIGLAIAMNKFRNISDPDLEFMVK